MTSIASLEELKEMRRVYIGLLYNAKDEKKISYLIKELNHLVLSLRMLSLKIQIYEEFYLQAYNLSLQILKNHKPYKQEQIV